MAGIDISSYATFQKEQEKWQAFLGTQSMQAERAINCEDSSGVLLTNCTSCVFCFCLSGAENCFSCWGGKQAENCDSNGEMGSEYGVMNIGYMNSKNCAYCFMIEHSYDILYSQYVVQSHDCFGCYGLKKEQYCIFNKQYGKEEYKLLKGKIIEHMKTTGEWGQFFPSRYSPFPYRETTADIAMSLLFDRSEDIAMRTGLRMDAKAGSDFAVPAGAISADQIPDALDEFFDEWCSKIFLCEKTGRQYRITKKELELYRRLRVPVPRKAWRTTFEEWYPLLQPLPNTAICAQCGGDMYSYLPPNKTTRRILCDRCFQMETG